MYFVSVTRLRLRSIFFLPRFLRSNEAAIKSIKKSEGFICGKELVDKKPTFWTVTVWETDKAMKFFRGNKPHQYAMQKMPFWCNEGSVVHWEQENTTIPEWDILHKRLVTEGRATKVKFPSPNNQDMNYPAPLWRKFSRSFESSVNLLPHKA